MRRLYQLKNSIKHNKFNSKVKDWLKFENPIKFFMSIYLESLIFNEENGIVLLARTHAQRSM